MSSGCRITNMPTEAPRRKTEPGRDSSLSFFMVAWSLMKPILEEEKRSMDWILRLCSLYGEWWNSWSLRDWRERLWWRVDIQFYDKN